MSVVDSTVAGHALIELDHVSRAFRVPGGTITAVDGVSLAIGAGEAICIVGESGCGKTTTGRMLAGILRPSSGRLLYEGQDVWEKKGRELSDFRRAVQLVHQDPYASLNPTRTVFQTLSAPIYKHKKAKGTRDAMNRVRRSGSALVFSTRVTSSDSNTGYTLMRSPSCTT